MRSLSSRLCWIILIILYLAVCCGPQVYAEDESLSLSAGFPTWGSSPALPAHRWSKVPLTLSNRAAVPQDAVIRITPSGQLESDVYERRVRLGPTSRYHFTLLMPATPANTLDITLSRPGQNFLFRETIPARIENSFGNIQLFFINDNQEAKGISALADMKGLGRNINLTRSNSAKAPQHLLEYGGAMVVIILDIDPEKWGEEQFQALRQFVNGGGTLLFTSPQTVMKLQKTRFAELLPALPLRLRAVTSLPIPDGWDPAVAATSDVESLGSSGTDADAAFWATGAAPLIEVAQMPRTRISASVAGLPLVCWQKIGHGRSGICAVNPFDPGLRSQPFAKRLWNHLLSNSTVAPLQTNALHVEPLKQAAERLVGFQAPQAENVGQVLLVYFLLLTLLFIFGILLRRQVWSWIAAVLLALLLTVGIFGAAYRRAATEDPHTLTSLDLVLNSGRITLGESILGLFSTADLRLDLTAADHKARFRGLPPAPALFSKHSRPRSPMTFARANAQSRAAGLNLQALKPLRLSVYFETAEENRRDPLPLKITAEGWKFGQHQAMEHIPGDAKLYLVLQNGFRRVRNHNGKYVVQPRKMNAVQLDPVLTRIETFLQSGRLPAPCLVAVDTKPGNLPGIEDTDPKFRVTRQMMEAYSCSITVPQPGEEELLINSESIRLEPGDTKTKTLYWQGEWQEIRSYGGESQYRIDAVIPPELIRGFAVSEVALDIPIVDPAGSVECTAALLAIGKTGGAGDDRASRVVKPAEIDGSKYIFRNLNGENILDPVLGRMHVQLTIDNRKEATAQENQLSTGHWRIKEFRMTVRGRKE